jgi:hypothetical protein
MRVQSRTAAVPAIEIARTSVQTDEQSFGSVLSEVARLLWPTKTAANLAALIGCTERAAEFYLSGQRDWSGDALNAIVMEVLRRHKMRNVKIVKRE